MKKGVVPDTETSWGKLWEVIYHKYYVDELYDALIVNRTKDLGNLLAAFDLAVIDGWRRRRRPRPRGASATVSSWFDPTSWTAW